MVSLSIQIIQSTITLFAFTVNLTDLTFQSLRIIALKSERDLLSTRIRVSEFYATRIRANMIYWFSVGLPLFYL